MKWRRRRQVVATCVCGALLNAHPSAETSGMPRDGDLSLCSYCLAFAWYDRAHPNGLRPVTDDERRALLATPRIRNMLHALAESTTPEDAVELIRRTSP